MVVIEKYVVDSSRVEAMTFEWGALQWLVNQESAEDAEMTIGVCTIAPGERNSEHFHPNCEEVLFVLEGECDHTLGDEIVHLTPGMMIRCPADMRHYMVNNGDEPMKALVIFSVPDRETMNVE